MFKYVEREIGTLSFSLRSTAEESTMIRVRIMVKGQRLSYHLPNTYKICPRHWDSKLGMAKTAIKDNPDLKGNPTLKNKLENINSEIRRTHNSIMEIIESFKARQIPYDRDMVKEELVARLKPESSVQYRSIPHDLINYFSYYISLCEDGTVLTSRRTKLGEGTIHSYRGTLVALRKFCDKTHTRPTIDSFSIQTYFAFLRHLNTVDNGRGQKLTQNTAGKFIKCLKAALRYAREMKYTTNDVYAHKDFRVPSASTEEVYLRDEELDVLYNMELPEHQSHVRFAFLISAYTGLRHSDLKRLNETHINLQERKLTIHAVKTGTKSVVPLNSRVIEILNRYGGKMPPVQENAPMNRSIKKICKAAGFTQKVNLVVVRGGERKIEVKEKWELVSCHSGRRTFASSLANKGISMIDLQNLTGHASEGSLRRYLRTSKDEICDKLLNETELFK